MANGLIGERPKAYNHAEAKPPARFSKIGELPPVQKPRGLIGEARLRKMLNLSEQATLEQVCDDAAMLIEDLRDKLGESEKAIHEASRADGPPAMSSIPLKKKGPLEGL